MMISITTFSMKCLKCGASDEIDVCAPQSGYGSAKNGTDVTAAENGDHEWGDDNAATCGTCGHTGKVVVDFRRSTMKAPRTTKPAPGALLMRFMHISKPKGKPMSKAAARSST